MLHIGKRNLSHDYKMKVENKLVSVSKCEESKDLGVRFDYHIQYIIGKANITNKKTMLGIAYFKKKKS